MTPLYGKLGELFGRKIILQVAIVLFLADRVVRDEPIMGELIAFRAIRAWAAAV